MRLSGLPALRPALFATLLAVALLPASLRSRPIAGEQRPGAPKPSEASWIDEGGSVRLQPDLAQPDASPDLPITVSSPDTHIRFAVSLRSENRLAYRVTLNGRPVIETSRLGIVVDGTNPGDGVTIGAVERARHDERYKTRGVHPMATNRYNAATSRNE